MVSWFRRGGDEPRPPPAEPGPLADEDSPAVLRHNVVTVNRLINANAGRLPAEAVVDARRVTDTLREVIDTSTVRDLDIYAVVSIKGIVNDYLPTTIRSFLTLDPDVVHTRRASGRTPVESLLEQIDALWSAADDVLTATQSQDVDALMTQGSFLRTKFTRSDLDL